EAEKVIIGPSQHTPEEELLKLKNEVGENNVISLGGGSIIDAVKIISPKLHIAIPTTLSGAEHTAIAGFTRASIKVSVKVNPPNIIILDPFVLEYTPKRLLITSAFRALDHAVEAYYSTKANLFTDALAYQGYKYLVECLEVGELFKCQIGTWISALSFMYAGRGLSHVFGYIFGPRFNIPHGVTSCISLPNAIKFNYPVAKKKIESLDNNLHERILGLMKKYGIEERLSKYAELNEALKYSTLLSELVNSSENPRKMSNDDALEFIRSCF
ncbi:MAG: iron-containing alcohol dehydrogenase, partial [Metallosphaera sp.]